MHAAGSPHAVPANPEDALCPAAGNRTPRAGRPLVTERSTFPNESAPPSALPSALARVALLGVQFRRELCDNPCMSKSAGFRLRTGKTRDARLPSRCLMGVIGVVGTRTRRGGCARFRTATLDGGGLH